MITTSQQLAAAGDAVHRHVTIRLATPTDFPFVDSLQKTFRNQVGFLPRQAIEGKIARGQVSIALENGEPAAYLLGQGGYQRDPSFGIIYQAAVSYDARRRLLGTALVQHFVDHLDPPPHSVRLIGLWCAQDIEANEFWSACGFEPIAAREGSRRRGRVHSVWGGRTPLGAREPLRFPRATSGGLMRARREVTPVAPGQGYRQVVLPGEARAGDGVCEGACADGGATGSGSHGSQSRGTRDGVRESRRRMAKPSLREQQRAFLHGGSKHVCIIIGGVMKYVPVAPFEPPSFVEDGCGRVWTMAA